MVKKIIIEKTLKRLRRLFMTRAGDSRDQLLYSKLAILEFCGWIEDSMDDIVNKYTNRKLKMPENVQYFTKEIVKHISGFEYNLHFRKLMVGAVGIVRLEVIERNIDVSILAPFKATLNALKLIRDPLAHTHLIGIIQIDSPDMILRYLEIVYKGLKEYERGLGVRP